MIKITLNVDSQTMEIMRSRALAEGFFRPSIYARYLLARGIKEDMASSVEDDDRQTIRVTVNNCGT